jgi:hypothetical protein
MTKDCFTEMENKLVIAAECEECGRKFCKGCDIRRQKNGIKS